MIREVKEETGIICEFKEMVGFREINNLYFGLPELYFIGQL